MMASLHLPYRITTITINLVSLWQVGITIKITSPPINSNSQKLTMGNKAIQLEQVEHRKVGMGPTVVALVEAAFR